MAKRMQEQEGEGRIVAKSNPTINLALTISTSCSTVQNPIASKSPGILKAPCQNDWTNTGKPGAREFNQDATSNSQGWQRDAQLFISTGEPVATDENQKYLNHPEIICTAEPVASGYREHPGDTETPKIQKIRNLKVEFGHIISMYHQLCTSHVESLLDCETN